MRHRDDAKEEAIIEAAIRLINQNGFADTSISKIAKEAGVSPATIYIYFESKEDLLNKLYLMTKERMVESVNFHHDPSQSWEESFKKLYDATYRFMLSNQDSLAFLEQCSSNPMISKATVEEGMKMFAPVNQFFEKGIKAGVFKPLAQQVLSSLIYVPMMSFVRTMHVNNTKDTTGLDQLRDCTLDAIAIKK